MSRGLSGINTVKFESDLRRSVLFGKPSATADGFADQLETVVVAALNRVAPLRTRLRRPPKPITRWLSADAVEAKRLRRDSSGAGNGTIKTLTGLPTGRPAVKRTDS